MCLQQPVPIAEQNQPKPTASQYEILFITLKSRHTVVGINNLTEDDMVGMVKHLC